MLHMQIALLYWLGWVLFEEIINIPHHKYTVHFLSILSNTQCVHISYSLEVIKTCILHFIQFSTFYYAYTTNILLPGLTTIISPLTSNAQGKLTILPSR